LSGLAAPRLCGVKADIPWNRTGGLVANRDGDNRPIAAKLPTQPEPSPYPNGARAYVAKRPVADLCMVFTRGVQNRSAVDLACVWI